MLWHTGQPVLLCTVVLLFLSNWLTHISCWAFKGVVCAAPGRCAGYFQDNIVTHLVAGLGAGFFAVCVGSPVDVVKSRVMGKRSIFAAEHKGKL